MIEYKCTYIGAIQIKTGFDMENAGIIKEIDSLGRLQIPKDIRKRLGLCDKVELVLTADGLLIKSNDYKLIKICDFDDTATP